MVKPSGSAPPVCRANAHRNRVKLRPQGSAARQPVNDWQALALLELSRNSLVIAAATGWFPLLRTPLWWCL